MNVSKKRWISAGIGAGALVLASVGGVAAMTLSASADTSVTTPAQTAKDATDSPGVEDGLNDGETADDQGAEDGTNDGESADDEATEAPGTETADDQGAEDGTNDGESADDTPAG